MGFSHLELMASAIQPKRKKRTGRRGLEGAGAGPAAAQGSSISSAKRLREGPGEVLKAHLRLLRGFYFLFSQPITVPSQLIWQKLPGERSRAGLVPAAAWRSCFAVPSLEALPSPLPKAGTISAGARGCEEPAAPAIPTRSLAFPFPNERSVDPSSVKRGSSGDAEPGVC